MADDIIDFDGFEKYGPIANGSTFASFIAGNFTVSNANNTPLPSQGFGQEWLSVYNSPNTGQAGLIQGLSGTGIAYCMLGGSNGSAGIRRSLPANYVRMIFGFAFMSSLGTAVGIQFMDAGTAQLSVWCDTAGRLNVSRSAVGGANILYTSAAVILSNTRNYVEIDFTINNSTGQFTLKLNGNALTTLTGQNTRAGSNNYVNQFDFNVLSNAGRGGFDDTYWRDNTGGTGTFLGDVTIDGLRPTADSAVAFTPQLSAVGPYYISQTVTTDAPGAGQLVLIPVTPQVNMTLNNIGVFPSASSATVKNKGVVYSDSTGAPGSLLSSGTETTGMSADVPVALPLVTPQALTAGTQYWIGYITDTSVALHKADNWTGPGQKKANTYASGAPAGPLSGMTTGQAAWCIWGGAGSAAANFAQINLGGVNATQFPANPIVGNVPQSYNQSSTVSQEDLFTISDLSVTPTAIYAVKVSILAQRSDAGARTGNIRVKSGGTTANGSNSGFTPPTTMNWIGSLYFVDPNTSAAWTASGINAMTAGYQVAS